MNDETLDPAQLPAGAVIAATDLSDGGAEVIAQAHAWAQRVGAPLAVCHAVERYDAIAPLLPHLHQPLFDHQEEDAAIERIQQQADGLNIEDFDTCILSGSPHAAIIELMLASPPLLLVIGATEKSAVVDRLLGSTAEQLAHHAPCSVLVARKGAVDGPVMAATDLSDPAMKAVQAAAEEAERRDCELVVAHALDLPRQLLVAAIEPTAGMNARTAAALKAAAEQVIAGVLEGLAIEGRGLVVEGRTVRAICRAARDIDASLIVVGDHGHSNQAGMALGSTAEGIVRAAPCSVLIASK